MVSLRDTLRNTFGIWDFRKVNHWMVAQRYKIRNPKSQIPNQASRLGTLELYCPAAMTGTSPFKPQCWA